jgi:toxin-antitoxin system PIN domain toxin
MPRFTKSSLFPDLNVWIALTYERHAHHAAARSWFEAQQADARFLFCRFTQIGFFRLLTQEVVMGRDGVLNQREAWGVYDRWREDARVQFIDEPRGLEPSFRSMSQLTQPAPNNWANSYLAAFALAAEITLVTFDQAFKGRLGDVIILR